MKRYALFGLALALVFGSAFLPASSAQAQGAGMISSILNRMERNRRETRSLRAGLTMQKYNSQLKDYDMAQGQVAYLPGTGRNVNVRVDWTKPTRQTLSVLGEQFTLFNPRLNQAIQGNARSSKHAKSSGVLSLALTASAAELKSKYNVELAGEGTLYDGGPHVWLLKLTPRGGGGGFQFAEIWVADDGMPVQTRVTERNGDSTLVRLTGIQKNARVTADDIKVPLPAGVKIVKG